MAELKVGVGLASGMDGKGGGAGLGAELHGSRPSESYTEAARGLSTTKLAPKFDGLVLYVCVRRGVLNIVAGDVEELSESMKPACGGWRSP